MSGGHTKNENKNLKNKSNNNNNNTTSSTRTTSFSTSFPTSSATNTAYEFKPREERKPSTYSTYSSTKNFSSSEPKKIPEERFFELSTEMLKSLLREFGVSQKKIEKKYFQILFFRFIS